VRAVAAALAKCPDLVEFKYACAALPGPLGRGAALTPVCRWSRGGAGTSSAASCELQGVEEVQALMEALRRCPRLRTLK